MDFWTTVAAVLTAFGFVAAGFVVLAVVTGVARELDRRRAARAPTDVDFEGAWTEAMKRANRNGGQRHETDTPHRQD
jgi:hypothetical protein